MGQRLVKTRLRLLLALIVCLTTGAVSAEVRILAASSMTNVINELAKNYEEQTGLSIKPVFSSSSSLARQIVQGAPADLYLSANTKWADYVMNKLELAKDRKSDFAENRLVLVSPANSNIETAELDSKDWWQSVLKSERIAIGNPNAVPAGIYAKEALQSLNVWDEVKNRLAQTNNVRVALALAERGEVPLAIVYQTDALQSDAVTKLMAFHSQLHRNITYPLVNVSDSNDARLFQSYLLSDEGKAILTKYGFLISH
ncbi:molybdate ABC transporter substrate-binding protein [Vibrio nigripulchritudo]|uniref:molybdate ABC transporter substrate-binding protein n=1 Tax=Vibrio nigripulchritudo TaxID=28173 RepID=UPI00384FA9A9